MTPSVPGVGVGGAAGGPAAAAAAAGAPIIGESWPERPTPRLPATAALRKAVA